MAKLIYAALTCHSGWPRRRVPPVPGADRRGAGNPYLPAQVRVSLELIAERGFDNGMVHVRYRAKS